MGALRKRLTGRKGNYGKRKYLEQGAKMSQPENLQINVFSVLRLSFKLTPKFLKMLLFKKHLQNGQLKE